MNLQGDIREFPLSELLAMVAASAISGAIEIGEQECAGRIFCRGGRVYHVEAGERSGFDAIRSMVELHNAPFRFIAGLHHAAETLWPDPHMLIGFIRREEQISRKVRRYIPKLDWIPVLCSSSGAASIRLNVAIWPILALIDGQHSVAEIAALLGHEPLEIGLAISELIMRGLSNIRPPDRARSVDAHPGAATPSGAETAPSEHAPDPAESAAGGFFEWLLTGKSDRRPTAWFSGPLMVLSALLLW